MLLFGETQVKISTVFSPTRIYHPIHFRPISLHALVLLNLILVKLFIIQTFIDYMGRLELKKHI